MIGKATHGSDFGGLARYHLITSKSADSALLVWSQNLGRLGGEPAEIASTIGRRCSAVAGLSRAKTPAYHVIYRGVGSLTDEQAEWLIAETVERHGLQDCQAWAVRHGDDELHLGFNRVSPVAGSTRHRAVKVAHDYRIRAVLTKDFRERFGLEHEKLDGAAAERREGRRRHTDKELAQLAKLQAEAVAAGQDPATVKLPIDEHIREPAAEAWTRAAGDPVAFRVELENLGLELRRAGRGHVIAAIGGQAVGMHAALSSIERRKSERGLMLAAFDAPPVTAAERTKNQFAEAIAVGSSADEIHRQLARRGLALTNGRRGILVMDVATRKVTTLRRAKLEKSTMEKIQKIDPATLRTPDQIEQDSTTRPASAPPSTSATPTEMLQIMIDSARARAGKKIDPDDPVQLLTMLAGAFVDGWQRGQKLAQQKARDAARTPRDQHRAGTGGSEPADLVALLKAAETAAGRRAFDKMPAEKRAAFGELVKKAESDSYNEVQSGLDTAYQAAGVAIPGDRDGRRQAIEDYHRERVSAPAQGELAPPVRKAVDDDRTIWQARATAQDPYLSKMKQINVAAHNAGAAVSKANKRLSPPARSARSVAR